MSKGGYRGGSTTIGRKDSAWFGKQNRPPKPLDKLTPEERTARIASLHAELSRLEARIQGVNRDLKTLNEQEAAWNDLQRRKRQAEAINAKHGRLVDRQTESLQNAINELFRKSQ